MAFFLSGCVTLRDISSNPSYRDLVGQEIVSQADLLIVREGRNFYLQPPNDNGLTPKLENLKPFPFKFGGLIVEGLLPTGSRLRVSRIIETATFENASADPLAVLLDTNTPRLAGKEINLTLQMERTPGGMSDKLSPRFFRPAE